MLTMEHHNATDLSADGSLNTNKSPMTYSDNGIVGIAHGPNGDMSQQMANFASQGMSVLLVITTPN